MSFSHSGPDQATAQYNQYVAELVDYAVENFLQDHISKEKDLVALYFAVMSYIGSYITNYPRRVDSLQFRPETASATAAYDYIVHELFNKTHWRDALNVPDKMSEILLGLKMKLQASLALEAESGYLVSGILNAFNHDNPMDPQHLELAWELLREKSINKKLSAGLSQALAAEVLKNLNEGKKITDAQLRLIQEVLMSRAASESLMDALSNYLALAVLNLFNKKQLIDPEHLELTEFILKDQTLNARLIAALGGFEHLVPALGKQPVNQYKTHFEDDELYSLRMRELLRSELAKQRSLPAVNRELELKKRRELAEKRLLALSARDKKPVILEREDKSNVVDGAAVQSPEPENQQVVMEREKRRIAAERLALLSKNQRPLPDQNERLVRVADEVVQEQELASASQQLVVEREKRSVGIDRLALLAMNQQPLPVEDEDSDEEKELVVPADERVMQKPVLANPQAVIERDKRAQAAQERLAKLRVEEAEKAAKKKIRFAEQVEIFEYNPLSPLDQVEPPPVSKTPWWKYALAIAGFFLGAAAIATGVGALVGVTIWGVSLASMGVAAAGSTLAAGAMLLLGCSTYLGSAAYSDHKIQKKQQALLGRDQSAQVVQGADKAASRGLTPRSVSSVLPPSALKREARSQSSAPVSVTEVSLFSGTGPAPVADVQAQPLPSRKCCFT